jgi:glutamine---fructose-6-phosphate transaminase (isomerizing)
MSGLVGAIARRDVMPMLIGGLQKMESRECDSSGIAGIRGQYRLAVHRCAGPVSELERGLREEGWSSPIGLAHTRRATHGAPALRNVHPQVSHRDVAVVHDGVVENHECLRNLLMARGYRFRSESDAEVVAHLVHHQMKLRGSLFEAVRVGVQLLSGSYAIAVMVASEPDRLLVACQDRPLVIGTVADDRYVASGVHALPDVEHAIALESGDVAQLDFDGVRIVDADGRPVNPAVCRRPAVDARQPLLTGAAA